MRQHRKQSEQRYCATCKHTPEMRLPERFLSDIMRALRFIDAEKTIDRAVSLFSDLKSVKFVNNCRSALSISILEEELEGVGIPVASAILYFAFPKKFVVIDRYSWNAYKEINSANPVDWTKSFTGGPKEYERFWTFCRNEAAKLGSGWTPRDVENSLFTYGENEGKIPNAHANSDFSYSITHYPRKPFQRALALVFAGGLLTGRDSEFYSLVKDSFCHFAQDDVEYHDYRHQKKNQECWLNKSK